LNFKHKFYINDLCEKRETNKNSPIDQIGMHSKIAMLNLWQANYNHWWINCLICTKSILQTIHKYVAEIAFFTVIDHYIHYIDIYIT